MNLKFWYKSLVQLCIGIAIGCIGSLIYTGKWESLPGWVAALFWSVGWRMEISESEYQRREARYWKNTWMNNRKVDLTGLGRTEHRYVTQEELDARRKRIMEYDFTESKEKKENA